MGTGTLAPRTAKQIATIGAFAMRGNAGFLPVRPTSPRDVTMLQGKHKEERYSVGRVSIKKPLRNRDENLVVLRIASNACR